MAVIHYLCALIVKDRPLAYLLVGKDGTLIDCGGALSAFGLGKLETGGRFGEALFFLEGFLPLEGEAVCLPRVKTGSGGAADIHVFSGDEGDWVLLLDAAQEEARDRVLQQRTNELGLLRRKLAKLSAKQAGNKDVVGNA